jgi:hypothetical protein
MAGTIIADTIQATSQQISLNVGNTTILTASSTGLTLIPSNNVTINVTNSNATLTNATVTGTLNVAGTLTLTNANTKILNSSGKPILQQTGSVLQVVSVIKQDSFTTTSSSFTDITGLSVSITPSSTSSKILVLVQVNGSQQYTVNRTSLRLLRDATAVNAGAVAGSRTAAFGGFSTSDSTIPSGTVSGNFLDSPATTSSITYKMQVNVSAGSGTAYINRTQADADEAGQIRMASNITLMEIAG